MRLATQFLIFVLAPGMVATTGGCQVLLPSRPVAVLVRDAETKQPITGAAVKVWYPAAQSTIPPTPETRQVGADGVAHIHAAASGYAALIFDANAAGYAAEEMSVPVEKVAALPSAHWFQQAPAGGPDFILELYSDPHPTIEFVLPDGFRGVVQAEARLREDVPYQLGQRLFRYAVSPGGNVEVNGPKFLRRVHSDDYRARYANGTELGSPSETAVGFRWLRSSQNIDYFVVGDLADFNAQRRPANMTVDGGSQTSGKRGGGHGGHGGRHGGGSSSQ